MSDLTNYTERSDRDLALGAGVQAGNHLEAMRRLRVAVEEQTRAAERQRVAINPLSCLKLALAHTPIGAGRIWIVPVLAQART